MRTLKEYLRRMRDDLPLIGASEIRLATLLVGMIEVAWSITGMVPPPQGSLFATRLRESGMGDEWFLVMMLVGALTCAGAVLPWRSGRHIGLFLSALLWVTLTGIFIDLIMLSPVTATMPLFGAFSIGLMYADARRKPREKLDS